MTIRPIRTSPVPARRPSSKRLSPDELVAIATRFLALGLRVFPLNLQRQPACCGWQALAAGTPDKVRSLFGPSGCDYPNLAGVGVLVGDLRCPEFERSGRVLVAVDLDDAGDLEKYLAVLPATKIIKTNRGFHLWYWIGGDDVDVFKKGKLSPTVDLLALSRRDREGYVPAPGTWRQETDTLYAEHNDLPIADLTGPARDYILAEKAAYDEARRAERDERREKARAEFLARHGGKAALTGTDRGRFEVLLAEVCAAIRSARPGSRHEIINSACYKLGLWLWLAPDQRERAVEAVLEAYTTIAPSDDDDRRDAILEAIGDGERDAKPRVSPWKAGLWSRERKPPPLDPDEAFFNRGSVPL
jgi:Bifunctional DNA primase/polymerase, N-terminal